MPESHNPVTFMNSLNPAPTPTLFKSPTLKVVVEVDQEGRNNTLLREPPNSTLELITINRIKSQTVEFLITLMNS